MTKQELAKKLAERAELDSTAQGALVIDIVVDSITEELTAGGTVPLRGFGTFSTSHRKARTGRNPQTGETIRIQAHRVARFSPGSELKDAANSWHFGPDWFRFKDISTRVNALKGKIESRIRNADSFGTEARQYLDKAQAKYEVARDQIKKASSSSGKAWGEVKDGLDKAFAELKDAWDKAKKHF